MPTRRQLLSLPGALAAPGLLARQPDSRPREVNFENTPALEIANDKLALTVTLLGGTFARLVLAEEPDLNPLWEPVRFGRETGRAVPFNGGAGHFLCVDGFGPVSAEERAAGLPGHGEAHLQKHEVRAFDRQGGVQSLTIEATLPLVQEKLTRRISLAAGESMLRVDTKLENLLAFDRPVHWAEHGTVGSPFLESGQTVVDVSGRRSQSRPYDRPGSGPMARRLASGKDFDWPMAPGLDGAPVDLRLTPVNPHWLDHSATLIDPERKYGWTTALHPARRLVVGYLFRREEFPWVQYWGNYPANGKLARGLEFSTQPYDVSRREVVSSPRLFGAPMYRWLPAKSAIEASFLMFYARVPAGMAHVDDVRLENGRLIIEDRHANSRQELPASQTL